MNIHKNARATPHSRLLMVRRVIDAKQPHRLPPERVAEIERLRRQRMSSPVIARQLSIPISPSPGAASA